MRLELHIPCEISSSHGGEYEAQNLLGCTAVFIALMMEAARTSETLVDIRLRTWQYIPDDSELHTHSLFNYQTKYFITYNKCKKNPVCMF
jgi:hypothetical protein